MGRTYQYQCLQCQYQVKLCGGADSGLHCAVQTVICHDCQALFDVFTRKREEPDGSREVRFPAFFRPEIPPVILRDKLKGNRLVWREFRLACPTDARHFVELWNDPGRCPKCGNFMEKTGLPFRVWE